MLKYEPALKCVFFVGEEAGCIGSYACDMSFFNNVKYVIQCDRRNRGDFINCASGTELCDDNFVSKELKERFGYKNIYGLMTDIMALKKRGLNVACCNLSCGYYNPHTASEYTKVDELINCLKFVREIVRNNPTLVKHENRGLYNSMGTNKYTGRSDYYSDYRRNFSQYSHRYYDWELEESY